PVTLNGGTLDIRRDSAGTYNMNVAVTANSTINAQNVSGTPITIGISSLTIGNNTLTRTGAGGYTLQVAGTTTLTGNATIAANNDTFQLTTVSDGGAGFGITKTGGATLQITTNGGETARTPVNTG